MCGLGMLTGATYSFGHMIPSHLGPAYALLVQTNTCSKFVVIYADFALRTPNATSRFFFFFFVYYLGFVV